MTKAKCRFWNLSAVQKQSVRPYRDHRSKADLYAEAKKRDIPNRSKMNKAQLERALGH